MTKADRWLVFVILLSGMLAWAIHGYMSQETSTEIYAVVKVQGEVRKEIRLTKGEENSFMVEGKVGPVMIEVRDKKVRIAESSCPQQICVRRSWISAPGESIICVPNEIVIYIDVPAPVDAITR